MRRKCCSAISRSALAILACLFCSSAYASTESAARPVAPVPASLTLKPTQLAAATTTPPQTHATSAPRKVRPGISRSARPATDGSVKSTRAKAPLIVVTNVGPGQSGYVHYFLLKFPDGDEETAVGIELPDQRIAWSFPDLGVVVSPFIGTGVVQAGGKQYEVRHLYGLRPFPDDASMRRLQAQLLTRVLLWVEDATPYCNLQGGTSDQFCMSCLGFALRVIFPGPTPEYPVVPRDFPRTSRDVYYTTEDLLLYLVGLHSVRGKAAQLRRIKALALPASLREDAIRIVNENSPAATVADSKNRPGARPPAKSVPQSSPQSKPAS